MPEFRDFLVCGISSQIHQAQDAFDQIIADTDDFFGVTGLQVSSVVRLNFLSTLPTRRMTRYLGRVPAHVRQTFIEVLKRTQEIEERVFNMTGERLRRIQNEVSSISQK